ncbi:MAG: MgtC/SapB family protein [Bacteroidetes bacterium]|nr:MgtC/SapB family protein [Bacteroidota bacterium]
MIPWNEILIRLLLAALFGGLVGLERERKSWAAGMRTHMMVCVGAALIMIVSAFGFSDILGTPNVTLDPSRIAAQVISGIGFIGAGAILFTKPEGTIRGLTTAAGLWTVSAIGLATGAGMYFAGVAATILALIILWVLQPIERRYVQRFKQRTLKIITTPKVSVSDILKKIESVEGISFSDFVMFKNQHELMLQLRFEESDISKLTTVIEDLQREVEIKQVYWNR